MEGRHLVGTEEGSRQQQEDSPEEGTGLGEDTEVEEGIQRVE